MSGSEYIPPYRITPTVISLVEQIGEALGVFSVSANADSF